MELRSMTFKQDPEQFNSVPCATLEQEAEKKHLFQQDYVESNTVPCAISEQDEAEQSFQQDPEQSNTVPCAILEQEETEPISGMSVVKGPKKLYKQHYCVFCGRPQTKLQRHLLQLHSNESKMVPFLNAPRSKKKTELAKLRNLGDYEHNKKILEEGKGELVVKRRRALEKEATENDFVPCKNCFGFFYKLDLWRHSCPAKKSSKERHGKDNMHSPGKRSGGSGQGQVGESSECDHDGIVVVQNEYLSHNNPKYSMDCSDVPKSSVKFDIVDSDTWNHPLHQQYNTDCIQGSQPDFLVSDKCVSLPNQHGTFQDPEDSTTVPFTVLEEAKEIQLFQQDLNKSNLLLSAISEQDVTEQSFQQDPEQSYTVPCAISEQEETKPISGISVVKGPKKLYKQHYCMFCGRPQTKLQRHLLKLHSKELDMAPFLKATRSRKKIELAKLRNTGDYLHNKMILEEGKGELVVKRRRTLEKHATENDFVPCKNCLGFFYKRDLWRHQCPMKNSSEEQFAEKDIDCLRKYSASNVGVGQVEEQFAEKDIDCLRKYSASNVGVGQVSERSEDDNDVQNEYLSHNGSEFSMDCYDVPESSAEFDVSDCDPEDPNTVSYTLSEQAEKRQIFQQELEADLVQSALLQQNERNKTFEHDSTNSNIVSHAISEQVVMEQSFQQDPEQASTVSHAISEQVVMEQTFQQDPEQSNTVPCAISEQEETKPISGISVVKGPKKLYKQHYCMFCGRPQTKLQRHLLKLHSKELDMVPFLKATRSRKKIELAKLRNTGDYLHNKMILEEGKGELVVKRRRTLEKQATENDFVPCKNCLGFFYKRDLWRHQCPMKNSSEERFAEKDIDCLRKYSASSVGVGQVEERFAEKDIDCLRKYSASSVGVGQVEERFAEKDIDCLRKYSASIVGVGQVEERFAEKDIDCLRKYSASIVGVGQVEERFAEKHIDCLRKYSASNAGVGQVEERFAEKDIDCLRKYSAGSAGVGQVEERFAEKDIDCLRKYSASSAGVGQVSESIEDDNDVQNEYLSHSSSEFSMDCNDLPESSAEFDVSDCDSEDPNTNTVSYTLSEQAEKRQTFQQDLEADLVQSVLLQQKEQNKTFEYDSANSNIVSHAIISEQVVNTECVMEQSFQQDPEQSNTVPCAISEQEETEPISGMSVVKGPKKLYKQHYCMFCGRPQTKLQRHLLKLHSKELDMVPFLKATRSRKKIELAKLRNTGDYLHNKVILEEGKGELVVKRRRTLEKQATENDFVPCKNCLGFFYKRDLWRHQCPMKNSSEEQFAEKDIDCLRKYSASNVGVGQVSERSEDDNDVQNEYLSHNGSEFSMDCYDVPESSAEFDVSDCDSEDSNTNTVSYTLSEQAEKRQIVQQALEANLIPTALLEQNVAEQTFQHDLEQSYTVPCAISEQEETKPISGMSVVKGPKKLDKQHYCMFCGRPQTKLQRHLLQIHSDESDMVPFLNAPRSKKKIELAKLRNLGDYEHNKKILEEGKGELVVRRRRDNESEAAQKDFVPCKDCRGFYNKRDLWRHQCPVKKSSEEQLAKDLIESLGHDDVAIVAQKDDLIKLLAKKEASKNDLDKDEHSSSKNKLRDMARFLVILRKVTKKETASLSEFINCEFFSDIVRATKELAGYAGSIPQHRRQSIATEIGHSFLKCSGLLKAKAVETGDASLKLQCEEYQQVHGIRWKEEISWRAPRTQNDKRENKTYGTSVSEVEKCCTQYLGRESAEARHCFEDKDDKTADDGIGSSDLDHDDVHRKPTIPDDERGPCMSTLYLKRDMSARRKWDTEEEGACLRHFTHHLTHFKMPGRDEIVKAQDQEPILKGRTWIQIKNFVRNKMKKQQ